MTFDPARLRRGLVTGLGRGWRGFWWLAKILVPISLATSLLVWSGLIEAADFLFQPAMSLLHLPAAAAWPLFVGLVAGVYAGIGAMTALPFTTPQMTLMAIFLLLAHNFIQEGVVQGKSGLHPLKATLFRLAAACLCVVVSAQFLDASPEGPGLHLAGEAARPPFLAMLQGWALAMLRLLPKILIIVVGLLTLLEIMKSLNVIDRLAWALGPLLRAMGLSQRVGFLWLTGVLFGLSYGAAVIVEEAREGGLSPPELEGLQLSVGLNHSVLEDTAIFMALGVGAFWLLVPRFLAAMAAVRLLGLWRRRSGQIGAAAGATDKMIKEVER